MENFRIESLEINKIGAFEHIKMDFPKKTDPDKAEIHILTGENGTGKSTILEVLANFMLDNTDLFKRFWRYQKDDSTWSMYRINNSVDYIQHYSENNKIECFQRSLFLSNYQQLIEDRKENDKAEFNIAFFAYSGFRRLYDIENINLLDSDSSNPFENALNFNKSIDPKLLLNSIAQIKLLEGVAHRREDHLEELEYTRIIESIEKTVNEVTGKIYKIEIGSNHKQIQVCIVSDGICLNFNQLPDGFKSIFSWIADLVIRLSNIKWKEDLPIFDRNFILFLDEIEVHLHPAWQRKILPVVQKLFKNAQIFISTHSPFVVGSVDGAWVHKLKKDGAYAVLDGEPILSEDAESYDTILEEVFGIKERFGEEIESKLVDFRKYTREILSGNESNFHKWEETIEFFKNQRRPDEIMSLISPQIRQINRILKQVSA
jgi:predicted ATP-binding protein involved in virulence